MKKSLLTLIAVFCVAFTHAQSIGIIGSATPTGWNSDTDMATTDNTIYTITMTFVAGAAKFRLNDAWTTNWGSNSFPNGTGTQNGADIPITAGTYNVTFNRITGAYSFATTGGGGAPAQPGNITGSIAVCQGSVNIYSVVNDPAATSYTWVLPGGWSGTSTTNSISATAGQFGGTMTVRANNTSGSSATRSLGVNVLTGSAMINNQPSTASQNLCAGASATTLTVNVTAANPTFQWYSSTTNSNSSGTLISGATSNSYSPSTAVAGTLYYYVVIGGDCTPTPIKSNVSGPVTITASVPNDNGANSGYGSGSFNNGSNGGTGFQPWVVAQTGGTGGSFSGSSDIGVAWGVWSGGGTSYAVRPFATPLSIGNTVNFSFDNGGVNSGNKVGIRLRNATGQTLTEFRFIGGATEYSIADGTGTTDTGFAFTNTGMSISIAYTAANTYSIAITKSGVVTLLNARSFSTAAGGQIPAEIEFFNQNAGNGSSFNVFMNNLSIGYPKVIMQPVSTPQTACQNQTAAVLSVTAYGANLGYQWYSNNSATTTGGTLIAGANASTYSPSTSSLGTKYYYVVVSSVGTGSCVPTATSTISGAVMVNASINYYADVDGDGFGNPAAIQASCTGAPVGYVTNNTDCNDNDNTKNATFSFFVDADGDGFGSTTTSMQCAVNATTPPAGYSVNNTDCNDNDNTINATFSFFVDADGDGFGSTTTSMQCAVNATTPPAGFSLDNTDCDDTDNTKHNTFSFYADNDGDSYGSGALIPNVCAVNATTAPAGYSVNNTDCDDSIAAINPGHIEVLYNGVDDNCDGNLDEGFQITTSLLSSVCNTTLASIGSVIGITTLAPGSAYTGWRVRATNGGQVQTIDRNVPFFSMTDFASYAYATTYTIDIELQRNGVWLGYYGATCQISTPAILAEGGAAAISPLQCGITLPKINTLVATTSIQGVTGYRFRVTNMTDVVGPNQVQIVTRTLNWFTLQMLTRYNYGTTYQIEVAVKTTGGFGGYGSPCEISSPAAPSLINCEATIATNTSLIACTSLAGVTQYRFQVTRDSDGASTTIDRSSNYFTYNNVPLAIQTPGAFYNVRVAVMTSGIWSPFGDICQITSPGAPAAKAGSAVADTMVDFKAVASPNPFNADFGIEITTTSQDNVSVKVYDMLGRMVESTEVKVSDLNATKVGAQYPAGVYNVIVSQSGIVKTVRVIKR